MCVGVQVIITSWGLAYPSVPTNRSMSLSFYRYLSNGYLRKQPGRGVATGDSRLTAKIAHVTLTKVTSFH